MYPFIFIFWKLPKGQGDTTKNVKMRKMVKLYIFRCFNFFSSVLLTKMYKVLTFFVGVPRSFDEKY